MDDMKPDGGPAFPVVVSNEENGRKGLSVRDWFAGQAEAGGNCPHNQHEHEKCAAWAFNRADAYLAERAK